ncbi:MAG: cupin domain-containing protein [Sphingobium sp.]
MTDFDVGARLAEVRKQAGLTQRALASRAGVPHSQIAMIERNNSSPSVASLRKILSGIPIRLNQFFEVAQDRAGQVVYRKDELTDLTSPLLRRGNKASPIILRQVGDAVMHNLQILHECYAPGADTGASMLEHDAHEGGIVVSGELELTVDGQVYILAPGDSYLFDSRLQHRFRNRGDCDCEVISACSPPYL